MAGKREAVRRARRGEQDGDPPPVPGRQSSLGSPLILHMAPHDFKRQEGGLGAEKPRCSLVFSNHSASEPAPRPTVRGTPRPMCSLIPKVGKAWTSGGWAELAHSGPCRPRCGAPAALPSMVRRELQATQIPSPVAGVSFWTEEWGAGGQETLGASSQAVIRTGKAGDQGLLGRQTGPVSGCFPGKQADS